MQTHDYFQNGTNAPRCLNECPPYAEYTWINKTGAKECRDTPQPE